MFDVVCKMVSYVKNAKNALGGFEILFGWRYFLPPAKLRVSAILAILRIPSHLTKRVCLQSRL